MTELDNKSQAEETAKNPDIIDQQKVLDFQGVAPTDYASIANNAEQNIAAPKTENQKVFIAEFQKAQAEDKEVNKVSIKDQLNKNATEVNKFLASNSKDKEKPQTLGEVFEKTSDGIKKMLFNQITTTLEKDPYLSDGGKLNKTGETVKAQIEKSLTPDRMNNLSFALLEKVVKNMDANLSKSGNHEQQLMDKVTLLMTLQNTMQNGGLSDLSKFPKEVIAATDISWKALQNFGTNFGTLISERQKAAGFDRTSKETRRKSIMEQSKYSKLRLAVDKGARDESVIDVVPAAFEKSFLYFDNQENTQKLVNTLMTGDGKVSFDESMLAINPETAKTQPTEKQINEFTNSMQNILKDIPADMNSKEGLDLKAKVVDGKFDKMMDSLGGLKDIAMGIMEWLGKTPWGKSLLSFFGKSFGLEKGDVDRLLNRPHIKAGVDTYMATINNKEAMSALPYAGHEMKLETNGEKWDIKTEYFKNSKGVVMTKEGDSFTYKKIDKDGKLVPLDKDTDKALFDTYMEEKDGKLVAKMDKNTFIGEDLNDAALGQAISVMYKSKTGIDLNEYTEKGMIDIGANATANIKTLLKNNKYIYSTEDIVSNLCNNLMPQIGTAIMDAEDKKAKDQPAVTPDTKPADALKEKTPATQAAKPEQPKQEQPKTQA